MNPSPWHRDRDLPLDYYLMLPHASAAKVLLVRDGPQTARVDKGAPSSTHRNLALELEDKSLDVQAAEAWERYLDAEPDTRDRPEILYRIGKLYMQAEKFDLAAL